MSQHSVNKNYEWKILKIFIRPLKYVPCTISMQPTTCVKYPVFYLTMEKYKWFNNILQGKPFTTSK
jgi:hypothetical protein